MTELEALITLNAAPGMGPKGILELMEKFGSAPDILLNGPKELAIMGKAGERALESLRQCPGPEFAEAQIRRAEELHARIIPFSSPEYPEQLKTITFPPVLLHVMGALTAGDDPAAGIVGTRHPTPYGSRVADALGRAFAEHGITVVSGLALGVDTVAHRSALEAGGRSIGVLGCGADVPYPKENRGLYHALLEQGAVVSEFPFGTDPLPGHFPRRNRIISGLSRALAVVEAGEKSGALITAGFALDQGKDIFAVPGNIYSPQSSGANRLLQQGAHPLLSPQDVLDILGKPVLRPVRSPESEATLSDGEKRIMALLSAQPAHIDDIVRRGNLPLHTLHPVLLSLQLKGQIKELAGMHYIRNRG